MTGRAIRERRFREDLYYRLNIAVVPLPPLRQRRQDIPLLAHHFITLRPAPRAANLRLAPESLARLMDYSWPGNIRELENTLHNAVLLSKEEEISPAQLRWRRSTTPRGRRAIMSWTTLFATSWRFPASRCGSE